MRNANRIHCLATLATAVALVAPATLADERTNQPGSASGVSFRLATTKAIEGFAPMTAPDGSTVYVSSRPLFTSRDVLAIRLGKAEGGDTIEFSLPPKAADLLTSSVQTSGLKQLAVVDAKKLVALATVDVESGEMPKLTGLGAGVSDRISRLVKTQSTQVSATVSIVPRKTTGKPNEVLTFDLFVSGVTGLKTYQFTVDATGGTAGQLVRGPGSIDTKRSDYIFGTRQAIAAVDNMKGRIGCVVLSGTANVTTPQYVGTCTFRASADALGEFTVRVRQNSDSFVNDAQNQGIPYRAVGAAVKIAE